MASLLRRVPGIFEVTVPLCFPYSNHYKFSCDFVRVTALVQENAVHPAEVVYAMASLDLPDPHEVASAGASYVNTRKL